MHMELLAVGVGEFGEGIAVAALGWALSNTKSVIDSASFPCETSWRL